MPSWECAFNKDASGSCILMGTSSRSGPPLQVRNPPLSSELSALESRSRHISLVRSASIAMPNYTNNVNPLCLRRRLFKAAFLEEDEWNESVQGVKSGQYSDLDLLQQKQIQSDSSWSSGNALVKEAVVCCISLCKCMEVGECVNYLCIMSCWSD